MRPSDNAVHGQAAHVGSLRRSNENYLLDNRCMFVKDDIPTGIPSTVAEIICWQTTWIPIYIYVPLYIGSYRYGFFFSGTVPMTDLILFATVLSPTFARSLFSMHFIILNEVFEVHFTNEALVIINFNVNV